MRSADGQCLVSTTTPVGGGATEAIEVAGPQLECGHVPSPYSPGGSLAKPEALRWRSFQSLVLGQGNVCESTDVTEWSVSGGTRWVREGDVFLDPHPSPGGWRGWVCTRSGQLGGDATNAEFSPFGKITT